MQLLFDHNKSVEANQRLKLVLAIEVILSQRAKSHDGSIVALRSAKEALT